MRRFVGTVVAAMTVLVVAGCGTDDAPEDPEAAVDTSQASADAPIETGTPTGPPADPADLESVKADVETVAVSLESFYRGSPYPETAVEVADTLAGAGLELSAGNTIGGYVYDPDAVEFMLCIEAGSGAWATYDTAPMTLRENGSTGGCPIG